MKFNSTVKSNVVRNHEGQKAFTGNEYTQLYSLVSTCLVNEPRFYGEVGDVEKKILDLVNKISQRDPEFILQLAYYTRTKMNLRTVSVMLLGEASLQKRGVPKTHVTDWGVHIINRVDEIMDVISYVANKIGGNIGNESSQGSLPSALKKTLGYAFQKFNEYQFAKYKASNKSISLRDAIRIVRPKPETKKQSDLYRKIVRNELDTPLTWETYISTNGSTKENWEKILPEMPIFAVLRNLNNLLKNKVSNLDVALNKLENEKVIKNSRILPFRFYSAFKVVDEEVGVDKFQKKKVIQSLNKAMDLSVSNVSFSGRTAIFIDDSGSMDCKISNRSSISHNEIGYVIASILNKKNPLNYTLLFGDDILEYKFISDNILSNVNSLSKFAEENDHLIGHSTDTYKCVKHLIDNNINVDRMIIISDCQSYGTYNVNSLVNEYRKNINDNCFVYSFNTNSYGNIDIDINKPNTLLISGWSDKIFDYIPRFEESGQTVVDEIRNLQLPIFNPKKNIENVED